jgi:hypothetical protein
MTRTAAPSHKETVAALRHFMAIVDGLKTLANNPALGRSDMKDPIIDAVTSLVMHRMLKSAEAVIQLSTVPAEPGKQKQWVMEKLQQAIQAQNNVLDHHSMSHHGTLDWATESQHEAYDPDDHLSTMEGLMGHYKPVA